MVFNLIKHAKQLFYSNKVSGLRATNVQSAIDEVSDSLDKTLALMGGYLSNYVMVVNTTIRVTLGTGKSATLNYTPAVPEGYKIITSYMLNSNNAYLVSYFTSSNNVYLRNVGTADVTDNPVIMQSICIRNI